MPLARVTLSGGRAVDLMSLSIDETYGTWLEGYPCARVNDMILARLAGRASDRSLPVHVIQPERAHPQDRSPGRQGPVELLPELQCMGTFRSGPLIPDPDAIMDWSKLTIIWFQPDAAAPIADFVTSAIKDVPWDDLAKDFDDWG
jgi:hypothetical protein